MTVQYIDILHAIWGGNIAALKGKTTRKKPILVTGYIVIITNELIKLHKYLFMTAGIFFLNGIPFFISLSFNITFTVVIHPADRKSIVIFKTFKEIYMYYLKCGFQITTLHVDGKFAPLQALMHEIPGGGRFELASASEHVPEIERLILVPK